MASSTLAVSTVGAKVYKATAAAPAVFNEVPECISLPMIGATRVEIDTTYSSATSRTRITGRQDGDELEFRFNFIVGNAQQQAIIDNFNGDNDNEQWRVTADAANSSIWGFEVSYLYCGVELGLDAQQILVVRVRISGDVDWDASL
jgi:hypothetical protein